MSRYRLINYTDVWGNDKEGYEINDQCIESNDLIISEDASNKDILKYLKKIGFFTTDDMRKIKVINEYDIIEFYGKNMYEQYDRCLQKKLCKEERKRFSDFLNNILGAEYVFPLILAD